MLDSSTFADRLKVSRRDFMKVASRFGLSSTILGAASLGGIITLPRLADAATSTYKKRFKKKPRVTLKFGANGLNLQRSLIEQSGTIFFTNDLEERSDGEIRIEYIGDNQICGQLDCVKKTQQGIVDLYVSSTQNAAASAPYFNVLDFAYMFPSRASVYYFLYHPKSEKIFREPMRKLHNLHCLYSHAELRGIMLGLGWKNKPTIKSIEELAGTKNRVTGTQLGKIAMDLLKLNPAPIAWEETLDGLKQGLIDGAETWMSAAAWANMSPVISQAVDLQFFAGTHMTALNVKVFDKLGGALQDAVMESSYTTQVQVQAANEIALVNTVGASIPQKRETIFGKAGVRIAELSESEIKKAEEMCAPSSNPKPWEKWRNRLNGWAGGVDVYKEIHAIAREIPRDTLAENVEPRRWWRG